jgi:site-specific DNA recombinase
MAPKKFYPASNGHKSAIIYCRVSTKSQEEGTSLETQAVACIKYAESQGYKIGRVTKEVFSGAELWDRPQLARDRAALKAGEFQALICYSTDRLSRDPIHLALIAEECERAGVPLLFVTEPMDTSPEAALIRYVKGYAAQMEREKIRERMMRGRKAKLQSGKPSFVGDGLFGYRSDRENERYVVDESEAVIVRRVFGLCLSGFGASFIAKRFNEEGIPSPKASKSTWKGKAHWCQAAIYNILKNPAYKGEEYGWRTKRVKGRDTKRPKSDWIKLPDGIRPAIVSISVWDSAQEILGARKGTAARNLKRPVLLRDHLHCSVCGRGMHFRDYETPGKGHNKYRCNSRFKLYETGCDGATVPYQEMNNWIWEEVKAILRDPSIVEREVVKLEKGSPNQQLTRDLESAKRQLNKVERGLQALLHRFRESADDKNLWPFIEREIGQATKEKAQLEATISEIESRLQQQANVLSDLHSLKEYCAQVGDELDNFSFDDKLLAFRGLGLKVFASGDDKRKWRYEVKVPFDAPEQNEPIKPVAKAAQAAVVSNESRFIRSRA